MVGLPAISTTDFLNRLGVNTHVEYTDGRYVDMNQVLSDLSYMGISQVRDMNLEPNNQGQSSYGTAAAAGIKFDLIVNPGRPISQTIGYLRTFVQAHPGAVSAIEGPNEINNFPISYNGLTGSAAGIAFQNALYQAVKSDGLLSSIPVYNVTSWPDLGASADYANYHAYAKNGEQPRRELSDDFGYQAAVNPGKPMVLTETGYYTLPNAVGWGGVDQASQAKMILNSIFDAASIGVQKIYFYQLLDAYADPGNNDQEKHFGFFDINNAPKTSATAVRNLTSILRTGAASSGTPDSLSVSVAGLPSNAYSMQLWKAPGVYDIVLWNEAQIWNQANHQAIGVGSSTVTLSVPNNSQIKVYDPILGSSSVQSVTGTSVQMALSDRPLVVEVTPQAAAPPPSQPVASGGLGHFGEYAYAASSASRGQGGSATQATALSSDAAWTALASYAAAIQGYYGAGYSASSEGAYAEDMGQQPDDYASDEDQSDEASTGPVVGGFSSGISGYSGNAGYALPASGGSGIFTFVTAGPSY